MLTSLFLQALTSFSTAVCTSNVAEDHGLLLLTARVAGRLRVSCMMLMIARLLLLGKLVVCCRRRLVHKIYLFDLSY